MARIAAKLCENAFQTIPDVSFFDANNFFSTKFADRKFCFLLIWCGFQGSTAERTSKPVSASNFALDRLILRSVRPKNYENCVFCSSSNTKGALLRAQELLFFEHENCSSSSTRIVLLRTRELLFFEHENCSSLNKRIDRRRTQELYFVEHQNCIDAWIREVLGRVYITCKTIQGTSRKSVAILVQDSA